MEVKKAKAILPGIREQVLDEMMAPGCVVTSLVAKYGISRSTLYKWRQQLILPAKELSPMIDTGAKFIEVSVDDSTAFALQKVMLISNDFALSIKGKISSAKLLEILKVLED